MPSSLDEALDTLVRDIADWPDAGVVFRDVTPLLADAEGLRLTVEGLTALGRRIAGGDIDKVVGIEARGFIFGTPVAVALGAGFVPARKAGKLPALTHGVEYDLEYGSATVEIHQDALTPGDRVLVVDDVLATGGTMAAVDELIARTGAVPVANVVVLEISALGGRERLAHERLGALRTY
ncbi:adenine phosphoribosyltransferase [Mumia zhuanghuii]|uniref:Adenine phosphoribosyltransferase n=1 Tax=Mumia zhuanghuii TaxID=2585211 RepID=A0A5C4M8J1_9ACTN|nr:adenine phosphoribosyltransferase [Mumia zhuanghuii]TNC29841.1 adenine phosphoribosyltransferase [Mumia zhuanghuii]TNC37110.1 adenine phosphoribosyltransferase [Mumia zhuanghuii]